MNEARTGVISISSWSFAVRKLKIRLNELTICFIFVLCALQLCQNQQVSQQSCARIKEDIVLHYICLKDIVNLKSDPSASEFYFSNLQFSSHAHPTTGRTHAHIHLLQNASNEAHK